MRVDLSRMRAKRASTAPTAIGGSLGAGYENLAKRQVATNDLTVGEYLAFNWTTRSDQRRFCADRLDGTQIRPGVPAAGRFLQRHQAPSDLVSTSRLGVGRLIAQGPSFSDLPPESRDDGRAIVATAKEMASFIDEFAVANRSASEAGEFTDLSAKPLVVLTAENGSAQGWMAKQDNLAHVVDEHPASRGAGLDPRLARIDP
jgi:hypothetical protein